MAGGFRIPGWGGEFCILGWGGERGELFSESFPFSFRGPDVWGGNFEYLGGVGGG
jgi:hypothetical protein